MRIIELVVLVVIVATEMIYTWVSRRMVTAQRELLEAKDRLIQSQQDYIEVLRRSLYLANREQESARRRN